MIEHAPWSLSAAITSSCPLLNLDSWLIRPLILFDDTQRLLARVNRFQAANDDALKRISTCGPESGLFCGVLERGWKLGEVEIVARKWSHKIGASLFKH